MINIKWQINILNVNTTIRHCKNSIYLFLHYVLWRISHERHVHPNSNTIENWFSLTPPLGITSLNFLHMPRQHSWHAMSKSYSDHFTTRLNQNEIFIEFELRWKNSSWNGPQITKQFHDKPIYSTPRPEQHGRNVADNIFRYIFAKQNLAFWFRFGLRLFLSVQMTITLDPDHTGCDYGSGLAMDQLRARCNEILADPLLTPIYDGIRRHYATMS